jgi:hypothetical protein
VTIGQTLATSGDRDHWTKSVQQASSRTAAEVLARIGRELETEAGWIRDGAPTSSTGGDADTASRGMWTFRDADGDAWQATVAVTRDPARERAYVGEITIRRAGERRSAAGGSS